MGAVAVVVHRVPVVVVEVVAADVVDVAVVVVVLSVAGHLAGVCPGVGGDVGVGVVDPGVAHRHDQAGLGHRIPGLRGVYVGVSRAGGAGVVHTPKLIEHGIVGSSEKLCAVVRLYISDGAGFPQVAGNVFQCAVCCRAHDSGVDRLQALVDARASCFGDAALLTGRDTWSEPHDQLAKSRRAGAHPWVAPAGLLIKLRRRPRWAGDQADGDDRSRYDSCGNESGTHQPGQPIVPVHGHLDEEPPFRVLLSASRTRLGRGAPHARPTLAASLNSEPKPTF